MQSILEMLHSCMYWMQGMQEFFKKENVYFYLHSVFNFHYGDILKISWLFVCQNMS